MYLLVRGSTLMVPSVNRKDFYDVTSKNLSITLYVTLHYSPCQA